MANEVSIVIRAKSLIAQAVTSATAQLRTLGRQLGHSVTQGAKIAAVAIGGVVLAARKLIGLYQTQARAESKLAAVLRATGWSAGFTSRELRKQAQEMQRLTGIGDEVIINSQSILASFRNIRGDVFRSAVTALLDMQTVMSATGQEAGGLEEGAVRLGKALNDPVAGLSALTRVGVTFTEQQKRQVRAMQEAGDIAGAQRVILAELAGEFGGAATAVDGNVLAYNRLKSAIGDVGELFGKAITDAADLAGVFALLTGKAEALQASGAVELWAVKAKAAMESLHIAAGPIVKLFEDIADRIKKTSAFFGAFSGRGGWDKLGKIGKATPAGLMVSGVSGIIGASSGGAGWIDSWIAGAREVQQSLRDGLDAAREMGRTVTDAADDVIESERTRSQELDNQLAATRARINAEADAAEAKERSEMAAAQAREREAQRYADIRAEWLGMVADEKTLLDRVNEAEKTRNGLIERRAEIMAQMAEDQGQAGGLAQIDAEIEKIQQKIDALNVENIPQRAADQIQAWADRRKEADAVAADDAKRQAKLDALAERERRGQRITKRGREMLEQDRAFKAAQAEAKKLKVEQDALQATRDAIQNQQLTELQQINRRLAMNLQAE